MLLTKVVVIEEASSDVGSEHDTNSALRWVATWPIARVRPKALDHNTFVRGLALSVLVADLVKGDTVLGREATMAHHYLAVDHVTQRQMAEQYREEVICLHIILCLNFTFEAIHFIQLFGLVVTPAHKEMLREANFPCEHEHDNFNGEGASIDEVTVEEVWVLL